MTDSIEKIENYKESNLTGSKYLRCNKITIHNPFRNNISVTFSEETAYILGEGENDYLLKDAGNLTKNIDGMETLTDENGNTITFAEMYKWFAIAYITEALKRDALKEQSANAERFRIRVTEMYDRYVVECWDNPEYAQVDFGDFYAMASNDEEITYEALIELFKVSTEV